MGSRKALILLAGAGVAGLGVWLLTSQYPAHRDLFPKCVLHEVTGLYCPGCGTTRAFHSLLSGDVWRALRYNCLLVAALPLLLVWLFQKLRQWLRGTPPSKFWDSYRFAMWSAGLILVYFVLRNLPWWPFCLLAPLPN